jgi:RNA polymerase sigma factor (sigma-70 family)
MGLHGRSPLLRLQSDERLITMIRRGNHPAFEVLVARYQSRLLAFCRHLLGSREDAEDVLQEALAAAFNAILADDRPINVRPWLYRIARNRCLNHLRRIQAVGVDSMDVHLSEHGTSTADKVHRAEEFWMLVGDIQELPETQKTALVLREMDALSYEQIAEAMETTVPSVKSLLVRARVSLAEAAEARMLSCEEVRIELAEAAEGLRKKQSPVVRRHLRSCERCSVFQTQLKETSKALTALLPIGPLVLLKKFAFAHVGHSAGASTSHAAGAAGVGSTAAAGGAMAGSGAGSIISVGVGAIASKAAAGLAAAALVTAGAVEVSHDAGSRPRRRAATPAVSEPVIPVRHVAAVATPPAHHAALSAHAAPAPAAHPAKSAPAKSTSAKPSADNARTVAKATDTAKTAKATPAAPAKPAPGRTQSQTQTTVLASGQSSGTSSTSASDQPSTTPSSSSADTSGQSSTTPASSTTTTTATDPSTTDTGGTSPSDSTTTTTTTSPTATPDPRAGPAVATDSSPLP